MRVQTDEDGDFGKETHIQADRQAHRQTDREWKNKHIEGKGEERKRKGGRGRGEG